MIDDTSPVGNATQGPVVEPVVPSSPPAVEELAQSPAPMPSSAPPGPPPTPRAPELMAAPTPVPPAATPAADEAPLMPASSPRLTPEPVIHSAETIQQIKDIVDQSRFQVDEVESDLESDASPTTGRVQQVSERFPPPQHSKPSAMPQKVPMQRSLPSNRRKHLDTSNLVSHYQAMNISRSLSGPTQTSGYRGFSTSITQSFNTLADEPLDACSLACCGLFQDDRNRYLLTNKKPPSCLKRFFLHVCLPAFLIALAYLCLEELPNRYNNEVLAISLVCLLLLFVMIQLMRLFRRRVTFRREILYQQYLQTGAIVARPEENEFSDEYLMGQSTMDLNCAHMIPCGFYRNDVPPSEYYAAPPASDLCGYLWRAYQTLCCGLCCGCYLQMCGVCGIAQETRDVNNLVPVHRRQIDYITMQHIVEYYGAILQLRLYANKNPMEHFRILSKLSRQIVYACLTGAVLFFAAGVFFHFHWTDHLLLFGIMFVTVVWVYLVYWPSNKGHISMDLVAKCFASGFCIATLMAFTWESLVGVLVRGIMELSLLSVNGDQDDYYVHESSSYGDDWAGAMVHKHLMVDFGKKFPIPYVIYLVIHSFVVAALVEELCKYIAYRCICSHPDFWTKEELDETIEKTRGDVEKRVDFANLPHIPTDVQHRSYKSRARMIIVAMIIIGLGFTCCENLLYAFVYRHGPKATSLPIMLLRLFLPIHPLCSALAGIGVVQRDIERIPGTQLGRILTSAVLAHGVFDLSVYMMDFLATCVMVVKYDQVIIVTIFFIAAISIVAVIGRLFMSAFRRQHERLERQKWIDFHFDNNRGRTGAVDSSR